MPTYNWMGGSEVSGKNSEIYKSKVIELMGLDGYLLIRDSSDVAMTPDLIFKKPFTEGPTEIWVESKYDDVSLYDVKFLSEVAKYFISYMQKDANEKFDLYFFIRYCKSWLKWRNIFESRLYKKDLAHEFFERINERAKLQEVEKEKLCSYTFDDFEKFLSDCYIHRVNYDGLLMKIDERNNENKFLTAKQYYTRELKPLISRDRITSNFSKVIEFPNDIFVANLAEELNYEEFYSEIPCYEPICPYWDKIFSLIPFENYENIIKEVIINETINKLGFLTWAYIDNKHIRITNELIKKLILYKGVKKGCGFRRYKGYNLFFEHNIEEDIQEIAGKQVTRLFKDTDNPFVKHKAIKVSVRKFRRDNLLFISPINLFTKDGVELITGEDVRRLHEIFSPNKYENNYSVFGDLKWWFNFLGTNNIKSEPHDIRTTDLITFNLRVRPPKNVEERDNQMITKRLDDINEI